MVWKFGALGWAMRKANKVSVGRYDVVIDYCLCYIGGGLVNTVMNIMLCKRQRFS
jgi:hypothetical protein